MTSATDPLRRFQRQAALQAGACWLLALLAAAWAWRVPVPAPPALAAVRTTAAPTAAATPLAPAAWDVGLWRPFSNEAAPTAAAPQALKLLSVMQQDGGLTAAISAGDAGLVFLKAGESGNGIAVVRVEANAVLVRANGRELRLELGP